MRQPCELGYRGPTIWAWRSPYHTAEMVRAMPEDGKRYETVHGELLVTLTPSPWHQFVLGRLLTGLAEYLDEERVGLVLPSPSDISWGPDTLVQPDLFVVLLEEARTDEWAQIKTLLLAIEIMSSSTARSDRFTKRRLYQEVGVPVYWIVDPDARAVEVWTPEARFPTVERERVTWRPAGSRATLEIQLGRLFRGDLTGGG